MSHLPYHNMTVLLNDTIFNSHKELIEKVVKDMEGTPEKASELVKKYLDKTELKAKKDPNRPKRPKSGFLHFCDDEFRMGWWDGSNEYNLDSKMKCQFHTSCTDHEKSLILNYLLKKSN